MGVFPAFWESVDISPTYFIGFCVCLDFEFRVLANHYGVVTVVIIAAIETLGH
jgi:hypothetical protein